MAAAFPAPLKLSVLNLNRPTRSCDTIHPIPHLDSRDTAVDADLHFSRAALSSFRCRACSICILWCTGRMGWMAYRKWKECKQQPGTAGPGNMLGCCLIYFHFLWAIHPIRPVQIGLYITKASKLQSEVRTRSLAVHPHLFWLSTPAYLIALGSSKI